MPHEISIHDRQFFLNGRPTYEGISFEGKPVEGLLFNARMIQAIFDDANPATRQRWAYPDTGQWDPDRNTDDFCAMLPAYRRHGLMAVTVGLQGGGSDYRQPIYNDYENSAYAPDGTFRPAWFERLRRILQAADEAGLVVIVNYFYWKHIARLQSEAVILDVTERVTQWLLSTGHRNILIDVANEAHPTWNLDILHPSNVHRLLEVVQGTTLDGRSIPAGISSGGGDSLPEGRWREIEDIHLPHGNGLQAPALAAKLRRLRETPEHQARPRPICVNEDTIYTENLDAAFGEYCSWGYYSQGYGSGYRDRTDWTVHEREKNLADLSGYQTVPVNWAINTDEKRAFFQRLQEITSGR